MDDQFAREAEAWRQQRIDTLFDRMTDRHDRWLEVESWPPELQHARTQERATRDPG